jgi:hypothetical protein
LKVEVRRWKKIERSRNNKLLIKEEVRRKKNIKRSTNKK